MVRPAVRARLPRLGRSARAGRGGRGSGRTRSTGPGRPGGHLAPRAPGGSRRDHGGAGAASSRGLVQGGQVLRGGRHRPAGIAPPPPPRPRPAPCPPRARARTEKVGAPAPGPRGPGRAEAAPPGAEQAWGRRPGGGKGPGACRDPRGVRARGWASSCVPLARCPRALLGPAQTAELPPAPTRGLGTGACLRAARPLCAGSRARGLLAGPGGSRPAVIRAHRDAPGSAAKSIEWLDFPVWVDCTVSVGSTRSAPSTPPSKTFRWARARGPGCS